MATKPGLMRLGRRQRWTAAEGLAVVVALAASGQSLAAFAGAHGLSAERVRWWRKRLRAREVAPVALVPVAIVGARTPFEVVVGAAVVRVPADFDEAALRRLVAALSC